MSGGLTPASWGRSNGSDYWVMAAAKRYQIAQKLGNVSTEKVELLNFLERNKTTIGLSTLNEVSKFLDTLSAPSRPGANPISQIAAGIEHHVIPQETRTQLFTYLERLQSSRISGAPASAPIQPQAVSSFMSPEVAASLKAMSLMMLPSS